jgi:hypothetical protein
VTHEIIIECNGVGPITGQDTITMNHYEGGIVTYAVRPRDDIAAGRRAHLLHKLEHHRYEMLEIMEELTGLPIYEAPP